jgi:hypothetical protein
MSTENFDKGTKEVPAAICIELIASELVEKGDDGLDLTSYLERSSMFVDNEMLTDFTKPFLVENLLGMQSRLEEDASGNLVRLESNGVGPYTLCWRVPLSEGQHTIQFTTSTTSGREFLYRWSFYLQ